tara:strand:- start:1493 stop:1963 length:471 start_codon:yes stop_codon:yes gene_type:complete
MSDPIDLKDKYFEILRSLGIVANIMRKPGYLAYDENSFNELLMLKWGYVEDIEGLDEFFEYVASTFKSPITWTLDPFTKKSSIYPNGFAKWWLFYPSRVDEVMEHKGIPHHEAYTWLCINEPEFGIQTNKEFNNFVRHLDACYSEWVKSGKLKPIS